MNEAPSNENTTRYDMGGAIADLVATASVRGTWAWRFFRWALRWGLRRGSVGAKEAAKAEGWAKKAGDGRLFSHVLPPLAWTFVFEDPPAPVSAPARAASLVSAALAFRAELASPSFSPELRVQCERAFGTTTIPARERYTVHRGTGRHVVVGIGGALRAVDVLDERGDPRSEGAIAADLAACLLASAAPAIPVLALTAASRAKASQWEGVAKGSPEAATLLQDAVFSVFFDPNAPADRDECGRLAQGGPTDNRCFWHALQIVVFANAKAAIVGSFVAGIEGIGALELSGKLGRAAIGPCPAPQPRAAADLPPLLAWNVGPNDAAELRALVRRKPQRSGGLFHVPGFGARAWKEAGVSAGAATVAALRLALDEVVPELDELECMVSLGHIEPGIVTRLGTTTAPMRAFLHAARSDGDDDDLGSSFAAAVETYRERVRRAKKRESAEIALEFSQFALARLSGLGRAVLRFSVQLVAWLIAWRAPPSERPDLHKPIVAVDSNIPHHPGIAAVGRFGVLAPPRSIWLHHSILEDELAVVIQVGPEFVSRAAALRDAIPRALARVRQAARARPAPSSSAAPLAPDAPPRLAYFRILCLYAALRDEAGSGP